MELAWTALMDSSDFVDWSPLNRLRLPGLRYIATLCVASVSIYHVNNVRERTRRQDIISIAAAIIVLAFSVAGGYGVAGVNCPGAAAAAEFSDQLAAVASFNLAACNAWCVAASSKTSPLVCALDQDMPTPSAAFESFAAHAGKHLETWCRQATGQRRPDRRELFEANRTTLDDADCSPFCRLKIREVKCASSAGWYAVLFATEFVLFLVGLLFAFVLIGEWCARDKQRKFKRNDHTESLVMKILKAACIHDLADTYRYIQRCVCIERMTMSFCNVH